MQHKFWRNLANFKTFKTWPSRAASSKLALNKYFAKLVINFRKEWTQKTLFNIWWRFVKKKLAVSLMWVFGKLTKSLSNFIGDKSFLKVISCPDAQSSNWALLSLPLVCCTIKIIQRIGSSANYIPQTTNNFASMGVTGLLEKSQNGPPFKRQSLEESLRSKLSWHWPQVSLSTSNTIELIYVRPEMTFLSLLIVS